MFKRYLSFLAALVIGLGLYAQNLTRDQYINKFKDIAIREMQRSGIPASITLGQGILESDGGNSDLSTIANNHFGVKCGESWTGKTYKKKDDDRNAIGMKVKSCFRSYKNAEDSYVDHSDFLTDPAKAYRYGPLFELDPTDYKKWAKGLKKAGYATSNTYDKKLIDIIEKYKLYQYDRGVSGPALANNPADDQFSFGSDPSGTDVIGGTAVASAGSNTIQFNNEVKYVLAGSSESVTSISERTKKPVKTLMKYNENLTGGDQKLASGTIVYLQPKRGGHRGKETYHTVETRETMFDISHEYGISLTKLYKRNLMVEGQEPAPGSKIKIKGGAVSIAPETIGGTASSSSYSQSSPDDYMSESDFNGGEEKKSIFHFGSKKKNKNSNSVTEKGVGTQTAPKEEGVYHIVAEGETLFTISNKYNTSAEQIKKLNNSSSNAVRPGMRIRVQ